MRGFSLRCGMTDEKQNTGFFAALRMTGAGVILCRASLAPREGSLVTLHHYMNLTPFSPITVKMSKRLVRPSRLRICPLRCINSRLQPADLADT